MNENTACPPDWNRAFREAIAPPQDDECQPNCGIVDIRATTPTTADMNPPAPPTIAKIAKIARGYGISSQYFYRLTALESLTPADWQEPDIIFHKLLDRRASPLRRKLSDPAIRKSIKKNLTH